MDPNEEFDDGEANDSLVRMGPLQGLAAWHGQEHITDEHAACSTLSPPRHSSAPSRMNASNFLMLGIVLSMVSIGLVKISEGEVATFTQSASTHSMSDEEIKWLEQNYALSSAIQTLSSDEDDDSAVVKRDPAWEKVPNTKYQPSVCPPGSFCPTGARSPILCPHGFFCPEGSVRPVHCTSGMFCPEGSKRAQTCHKGHYCPAGSARMLKCPAQHYCSLGADEDGPIGCPEGTFCPGKTEFPKDCPAAHFCPAKSAKGMPCPAQFFCPTKTSLPTLCPAGRYCTKQTANAPKCPGGTFCPAGTENPEPCPSGAYCQEGSERWIQCPPSHFCPANSKSPTLCPAGSYCPEGSSNMIPCPKGYNCPQGCAVPIKRVRVRNGNGGNNGNGGGSDNGNGGSGSGSGGDGSGGNWYYGDYRNDDESDSGYYYYGEDDGSGGNYNGDQSSGAAGGGNYYDDGKDANHDWCYWCSISPTPSPTVMPANSSSVMAYVEFPSNLGSDDDLFLFEEDVKARGLVWSEIESHDAILGFQIQFLERVNVEGKGEKYYWAEEDTILPAILWVGIADAPAFEVKGISSTEEASTFYAYTLDELLLVFTEQGYDGKEYLLLDFEESYLIRIRAENSGGVGEWSSVLTVDFGVDNWIYESSEMAKTAGYAAQSQGMDAYILQTEEEVHILQVKEEEVGSTDGMEIEATKEHADHHQHARKANLGSEISEVRKSATKFAEAMGIFRSMSISASVVGLVLGLGYVFGGSAFLTGDGESIEEPSLQRSSSLEENPFRQTAIYGSDY